MALQSGLFGGWIMYYMHHCHMYEGNAKFWEFFYAVEKKEDMQVCDS